VQQQQQRVFEAGNRTLYFSAGCVIENMRLAATSRGYQLKPSYFPNPSDLLLVATLHFNPLSSKSRAGLNLPYLDDNGEEIDDTIIEKRCTNRKFYNNKKIDTTILSKLSEIALSENQFKLHWMTKENPSYSKLCRILGNTDQIRYQNQRIMEEFVHLIHFNPREIEETKDGLDLRTFEVGPLGYPLFKLISSWKRMRFLNYFGMSFQFNLYTQLQMLSSQACGLLTAPNYEPINYVLGGEIMERIWHEIARLGISLQPMESLPIFAVNLELNGGKNFTKKQRKKMERLKRELLSLYGTGQDLCPLFLFRMGYASPPSARSLRRPVESFLIHEPLKVR
jgi:hypothetical protein